MKNTTITLENVENFSTSLCTHHLKWMFESIEENKIPEEVEAQIIPLQPEAAQFLLDFRETQNHLNNELFKDAKCDKQEDTFVTKKKTQEEIKRWLYQKNIPLDRKVFWVNGLNVAFVLTWKMVIKFSDVLFFGTNEILWDKTMNWVLSFDASEVFYFEDNLMFNPENRANDIEAFEDILSSVLFEAEMREMEEIFSEAARIEDNEVMSEASIARRERIRLVRQGQDA